MNKLAQAPGHIIKTMMIVSVAYLVCWFPTTVYFLIADNTPTASDLFVGYYPTVFLSYLYICMNPFIYAIKHEGVKEKLAGLVLWYKRVGETAAVGDAPGSVPSNRNIGRTRQSHTTGTAPRP